MPQEQPSALIRLSQQLNFSSSFRVASDPGMAALLTAAATALTSADEEIRQLKEKLDATEKTEDTPLTILVDRSPSFGSIPAGRPRSPLAAVLEATEYLSTTGTNLKTVHWDGVFSTIVPHMKKATATNDKQHLVVVSDGNVFTSTALVVQMEQFLRENPKTTLDFVVISNRKASEQISEMEYIAGWLQKGFPKQVSLVTNPQPGTTWALKQVAELRAAQPETPQRSKPRFPQEHPPVH